LEGFFAGFADYGKNKPLEAYFYCPIMESLENLDEVIEKIQKIEAEKRKLAEFLKKRDDLTWKVSKIDLGDMLIGGEDGGVTKKTTHLIDFVFLRAVSVIFDYRKGKLSDVKYYPYQNPSPEVTYSTEPLSDVEFKIFWSLRRLRRELEVSVEAIKKFSPQLFLIDGSLMIHPGDVPKKESALFDDYTEVKEKVKELYEIGQKTGCMIAGVVEDSRSTTFCNFIEKEILSKEEGPKIAKMQDVIKRAKDTNLLYYLLEKGEATREIDCGEGMKCIYMKTAEFDRPIRVEFLDNREKIANIIFTLSCESRNYGFPNVLIEADQRAKLSENDSLYYMNHIAARLGIHDLFFLRRENRPF
jgi:hypothetical protein